MDAQRELLGQRKDLAALRRRVTETIETRERLRRERDNARAEVASLQERLEAEVKHSVETIYGLNAELASRLSDVDDLEAEVASLRERLATAERELAGAAGVERERIVHLLQNAREALLMANCLETAYQDGFDSEMFATAVILIEAMPDEPPS